MGGDFVATASGASADLVLNGSNTPGGVSLTAGRDLSVTTASALRLDGLQAGRHATLTAGGAVTQGGGWQVTGDTQVQAAGFDISLTRTDNALHQRRGRSDGCSCGREQQQRLAAGQRDRHARPGRTVGFAASASATARR